MKKNVIASRLTLALSILTFIGSVISYPFLPSKIAVHWSGNWVPDRFVNSFFIMLFAAVPTLVFYWLRRSSTEALSDTEADETGRFKATNIKAALVCLILCAAIWLTIIYSLVSAS